MHLLQDRTQSDSESIIDVDHFDFEKSSGWNDKTDLDRYIENKDTDKRLIKKLIYEANKLIPLSSILFKKNIIWTVIDNQSGWTHKACCPFPDHQDSTPSFGYNSKDERFHCFGCQRTGNTVQFLAFMENKTFLEIAKEILYRFKDPEDIVVELDDAHLEKIDELLLSFSKDIRLFLQENKENCKAERYVESITWSLDVYLEKHSLIGAISFESLQARIEKLREYLVAFGHNT